jgi:hypothetical protein
LHAATSGAATLAFQSGSTFQLSLANQQAGTHGAPALTDYSKLTIGTGVSVMLAGGSIVAVPTGSMNIGDVFPIILDGVPVSGAFANTPTAAPNSAGKTYRFSSNGLVWDINYAWNGTTPLAGENPTTFEQTTGGDSVALLLVSVPEPGALVSLLGGLGILMGWRRGRAKRRESRSE